MKPWNLISQAESSQSELTLSSSVVTEGPWSLRLIGVNSRSSSSTSFPLTMAFTRSSRSASSSASRLLKTGGMALAQTFIRASFSSSEAFRVYLFASTSTHRDEVRVSSSATWRHLVWHFPQREVNVNILLSILTSERRKMSQNFWQLKPKVFVSRATAKIFRVCCSSEFAQPATLERSQDNRFRIYVAARDETRPSVWSAECLAMRTKERGCESCDKKANFLLVQGTLFKAAFSVVIKDVIMRMLNADV